MSKASKLPIPKLESNRSVETAEFETKVLAKSGWPKTPKETFKLALKFFLTFFS